MHADGAGRPDGPGRRPSVRGKLPSNRPAAGWKLGAAAGTLGIEGATGYLSPSLGAVMAAADVIVPLAIAMVLLGAILLGSKETCERAFRLLRWLANRPEPPAPGPAGLTRHSGVSSRQPRIPRRS